MSKMTNKEIWFKRKKYGWGWTPANAKGWFVILAFVVFTSIYPILAKLGVCVFSPLVFMVSTFALIVLLIFICYRTGEKPEWSWGPKL